MHCSDRSRYFLLLRGHYPLLSLLESCLDDGSRPENPRSFRLCPIQLIPNTDVRRNRSNLVITLRKTANAFISLKLKNTPPSSAGSTPWALRPQILLFFLKFTPPKLPASLIFERTGNLLSWVLHRLFALPRKADITWFCTWFLFHLLEFLSPTLTIGILICTQLSLLSAFLIPFLLSSSLNFYYLLVYYIIHNLLIDHVLIIFCYRTLEVKTFIFSYFCLWANKWVLIFMLPRWH